MNYNSGLKALIVALLGIEVIGADIVKKDASAVILADVMAELPKAMSAISGASDLSAEIAMLKSNVAAQQDLAAYVGSLFTSGSPKTQAIIAAIPNFIFSAEALVKAIVA